MDPVLFLSLVCGAAAIWLIRGYLRAQGEEDRASLPAAARPLPKPPVAQDAVYIGKSRRHIVIDCETTGFSANGGDRIVSLAAIELVAGRPTGEALSVFVNPGRKSHPAARRVHGLSDEFLAKQEPFGVHADRIAQFIGEAAVIGHNVEFDIGFLTAEMERAGYQTLKTRSICTMKLFADTFPGHRKSLDACCEYFRIDLSSRRQHHGAFVDANLTTALFQILAFKLSPPARYEMLDLTNGMDPAPTPTKFPLIQVSCQ